ncbi:hypothetical protein [Nocardia sp. XZ_19_385]|uniref:hypothetical protein n=1 Tax=Nocardia sp. XZ_19_385 TaxID=2769488 RepID=UPI001890669C|nr:hypothetical protein [Nocardia sp. XZ_19_385]
MLVLTACSALLTDYRAEAEKLEQEISAMPGVQRFEVSVADDFFEGNSYFQISANLPDATEPQISDVLTRLTKSMGTFDGLRERRFSFTVGDRAGIGATKNLEADSFLAAVRNVRQYTASVPDGRIFWDVSPTPRISVSDVQTSTAEPLAAIRAMIGATTAAEALIKTTAHEHWNVSLPLSADREAELRRQLSAIPWTPTFVVISNSHINQLTVRNPEPSPVDPDLAYDQLAHTVRTLDPTTTHPLRLEWNWFFYYTEAKRNEGFVHVGGCDYSPPTVFDDTLSPPALTVQHRMREDFDTCP